MAFWVFGYGSLLWNPGFTPADQVKATLHGYHRSFCMLSIHHRGTDERPGLVLALDAAQDALCTGVAFQVAPNQEEQVLETLRERELVSSAYYEDTVELHTETGEKIKALAYIINPEHCQYCQFDLEKQAQIISKATGGRGPNTEYLFNTAAHLASLGIEDADIAWLAARVRALTATCE